MPKNSGEDGHSFQAARGAGFVPAGWACAGHVALAGDQWPALDMCRDGGHGEPHRWGCDQHRAAS